MGRSWPLLEGSWALLAGPWGTKIDFPAVLVAKIKFAKNIEKTQGNMILADPVLPGSLLGALEPLLVSPYLPQRPCNKTPGETSTLPRQTETLPKFTSFFFSFFAPSWLSLGLHLGSLLGSILAQLRPKSPHDTLLFQKRGFSRNLTFSNKKSPTMTPRRHPRRPKIDPRPLHDDPQDLLFSTLLFYLKKTL